VETWYGEPVASLLQTRQRKGGGGGDWNNLPNFQLLEGICLKNSAEADSSHGSASIFEMEKKPSEKS
jgi:hypothetical protein